MKVLVAHDRESSRSSIVEVLKANGINVAGVDLAEDYVSAKESLSQGLYDLFIVDLTLPHIKNTSVGSYVTTQNLLMELFALENLHTPGDIIGITREAHAFSSIETDIGQHLMTVLEESDSSNWRTLLGDKINYVRKSGFSRQRSFAQHYDYDVLILTALDKEMLPYESLLELRKLDYMLGCKEFFFSDKSHKIRKGITFSIDRAGVVSAASLTQALLSRFRPKLVLMSGFCGGFKDKGVTEGDLIFFKSIIDWDSGRWGDGTDAKWLPRPSPISIENLPINYVVRELVKKGLNSHIQLVSDVKGIAKGRIQDFSYKASPMASGSSLVAHKDIISRIVDVNDKAVGVDMEAYGVAYACTTTMMKTPDFLVLKSVSDFADVTKDKLVQTACSLISATAVVEILSSHYEFESD